MKTIISYYSWKGHSKKVAETLAGFLGADLTEIESSNKFHIFTQAMKALFSLKSPIKPALVDLTGYDRLVIVTPVWCGKVPPFVSEYCTKVTGISGKPFHVITEMGGRGSETATAVVRRHLEEKGMQFLSSTATLEKDVESGEYIMQVERFAAKIQE